LTFTNSTRRRVTLVISGLDGREQRLALPTGARTVTADPIAAARGWYDLGVSIDRSAGYLRRFAGHLENGRGSSTG
jgi:phospholipase C